MEILGYLIIIAVVGVVIVPIVGMIAVNLNGEKTSSFQDHRQCKGIAKKVWDDIYDNQAFNDEGRIFSDFEEYWDYLIQKHKL